jgi:hypothetical protein
MKEEEDDDGLGQKMFQNISKNQGNALSSAKFR